MLAHEMSHIRNYDVRLMTYAAVLAGSIALLAQIFLRGMWFGGGRQRTAAAATRSCWSAVVAGADPGADRRGRDPGRDQPPARVRRRRLGRRADPLPAGPGVGAAGDLRRTRSPRPRWRTGDRAPDDRAAARPERRASKLFSTHPPTEDRIARLDEMAGGAAHRHETLTEGAALPPAEAVPRAGSRQAGDRRRRLEARDVGAGRRDLYDHDRDVVARAVEFASASELSIRSATSAAPSPAVPDRDLCGPQDRGDGHRSRPSRARAIRSRCCSMRTGGWSTSASRARCSASCRTSSFSPSRSSSSPATRSSSTRTGHEARTAAAGCSASRA